MQHESKSIIVTVIIVLIVVLILFAGYLVLEPYWNDTSGQNQASSTLTAEQAAQQMQKLQASSDQSSSLSEQAALKAMQQLEKSSKQK